MDGDHAHGAVILAMYRSPRRIDPMNLRRYEVTLDSVTTPVIEAGPADAREAVLFVHGVPSSGEDWAPLVEEVGARARAIAFDVPGFGRASKPRDFPYDVAGVGAFIVRLVDALGLERVHVVGHDFGGPWALEWAARRPKRLGSAVLMSSGVFFDFRWHAIARAWQTPLVGEALMAMTTRATFGALVNPSAPRPVPRALVDRMFGDLDAGTKHAILRLYRATPSREVVARSRRHDDLLRPLDVPALVLWGKHDPFVPVAHARHQGITFPRARAHTLVFEESGHWLFADAPEATRAALRAHVERVIARA
jgi:pimeloyl-ACP methyl ester carboxylesterase